MKETFRDSDINVGVFTSHSYCAASNSKALPVDMLLHIIKRAKLSRAETFQKHFKRTIGPTNYSYNDLGT